jgi:hypothetical protein
MTADPLREFEAVLHAIAGEGVPESGVLVEIEQFFAGNVNVGSIAPNLVEGASDGRLRHPGVDVIQQRLEQIRDHPDVDAVLIDVMVEWERYPDGYWPYAQAVHVVTTESPAAVDSWLAGLNADPAYVTDEIDGWVNPPTIPAGTTAAAWRSDIESRTWRFTTR